MTLASSDLKLPELMIEKDCEDLLLLPKFVAKIFLLRQVAILSSRKPQLQPDRTLDIRLGGAAYQKITVEQFTLTRWGQNETS